MAVESQEYLAVAAHTQQDQHCWFAAEPETIIMQPTTLCNVDCAYCYLPARSKKRDMTPDVSMAVASSIPDQWPSSGRLEIVWHGGEPLTIGPKGLAALLGPFEVLRRAERVRQVIQTNATLITDEWCDLFAEYDMAVGVSIDGPRAMNRRRVDRRGGEVFDRVMAGIEKLKERGIPFTVIAVISQDTTGDAKEILDFIAGLGCPHLGLNMEEKEGANTHTGTPGFEQARRFWRDTFRWSRDHPGMKVREIERLLEFLTLDREERAADTEHDLIPTVGWDGNVVLLSPELLGVHAPRYGDFIAGNVLTDPLPVILKSGLELSYVREFQAGISRCKATCDYFAYCQGSHAGNRFFEHGTFSVTETEHCRTSTQALVLALHDIAHEEREVV